MIFRTLLLTISLMASGCDEKSANSNNAVATSSNGYVQTMQIPDYGHTADGRKIWKVDEDMQPVLINGQPVPAGTYKEVVSIKTGNAGCTAVVVGPKVAVTAAHCGANGATSTFSIGTTKFTGKIERSSLYPAKDHDIAVIILDQEVPEADVGKYAAIGGNAVVGMKITLLGYGCTRPGGGGGSDGVLRYGDATIQRFSAYDMVSSDGAALCFGDSGGPAFVRPGDRNLLIGVNSKGDIRRTNYNVRTDIPETAEFFRQVVAKHNVDICGVNKDCGGTPPPPPPPPPPPECETHEAKAQAVMAVAACLQIPIIVPTVN